MTPKDQTSRESPQPQAARRPAVTGEYCCAVCGHRMLCAGDLPACPTCHQRSWRLVAWRPFTPQERARPGVPGRARRGV